MSQPGFSIESAASIIARDMITKHLATFAHVIGNDRVASESVAAAYIDGLAGVLALSVQGGHCDTEGLERAVQTLREAITRDLRTLEALKMSSEETVSVLYAVRSQRQRDFKQGQFFISRRLETAVKHAIRVARLRGTRMYVVVLSTR